MKRSSLALLAALALILSGLLVGTGASSASAGSSWGHVSAKTQTIKNGCRNYRFDYRVDTPGADWMAEFTLVNPNGRNVSTRSYESSTRPDAGQGTFQLCDATTKAGRYKIQMKVTSYDERDSASHQVDPGRMRLVERH